MKKGKVVFVLLLLFLLFLTGLVVYKLFFFSENSSLENDIISEKEMEQVKEDIVDDMSNNDVSGYNKENNENDGNNSNSSSTSNNTKNNDSKKYDQYFVANGFSGASDNVYYTKSGVLYHLILSTNEVIKVAKGVSKIENDVGTIMVYKGTGFELFEEDNYLTYID